MRTGLTWVAGMLMAGMSTTACGPDSKSASDDPTGGTGSGATAGTTGGSGGSMSGAGGSTGGSAGSGAVAGTGGSAGSGGGKGGTAGSGGAATPFGFVQYGSLQHYPSAGRILPLASALFSRGSDGTPSTACPRTTIGLCTVVADCPAMTDPPEPVPPPPAPTAGTITIRSSDNFTADLVPDAAGIYSMTSVSGGVVGEELITVTAAGGEVPAFTYTKTYPLLLLLTQPAFDDVQTEYVVSRAEDLVLEWDRGIPSLALGVQTVAGGASLFCSFPSEDGTGTIPSELLAMLDSKTELLLIGVQTEIVTAGEYQVTVSSAGSVVTPDRTRRAKLVLE
jgi:hypothetical protein